MKPVELSVDFCGIRFSNPFIVAASPSTHSGDMVRRAFDQGWAGVVWKTVGTITGVDHPKVSPCYAHEGWNEQLYGFENIDLGNDVPLQQSLREIYEVKRDYSDSVVIVSIRGENFEEKWKDLARRAEDAGADIIELMFSCPTTLQTSMMERGNRPSGKDYNRMGEAGRSHTDHGENEPKCNGYPYSCPSGQGRWGGCHFGYEYDKKHFRSGSQNASTSTNGRRDVCIRRIFRSSDQTNHPQDGGGTGRGFQTGPSFVGHRRSGFLGGCG